jgi:hypothetical protein
LKHEVFGCAAIGDKEVLLRSSEFVEAVERFDTQFGISIRVDWGSSGIYLARGGYEGEAKLSSD